ncbi:MAG: AmmeMemoRadiSam system protein A [Nitrospirae bacterium]|nr:AmmeMemoRadiSam system protein A [Nitrospirota bacterium]
MHPLVQLAKETVEKYIREGLIKSPPEALTTEMKERAGVFVSLKKKGKLRGCIGTFSPSTRNVAEEIIQNAISSSTRDPRFPSVGKEEFNEIDYSVDVLSEPERVKGPEELDPKRYGVIVKKDWRKGLLLPDLEGIDTVEEQISIAMQKAGIYPDEEVELWRFEVKRYV